MKNILFLLLLMAGIIVACDEDKLTPSAPQEFYEFPQGDSDYGSGVRGFLREI